MFLKCALLNVEKWWERDFLVFGRGFCNNVNWFLLGMSSIWFLKQSGFSGDEWGLMVREQQILLGGIIDHLFGFNVSCSRRLTSFRPFLGQILI